MLLVELLVLSRVLAIEMAVLAPVLLPRCERVSEMPITMLGVETVVSGFVLGVQTRMTVAVLGAELAVLLAMVVVVSKHHHRGHQEGC